MNPLIHGAATCAIALSEVTIEPTETGWSESVVLEIDAKGVCPWIDLTLEPGVTLDRWRAKLDRLNGRGGRIRDDRMEWRTRDLEGRGARRLHLPEMTTGDHLSVELERTWPLGAYPWHAGAQGAVFAELFVQTDAEVPSWAKTDEGSFWVSEPAADAFWAIPHPKGEAPAPSVPAEARLGPVELVLDLKIPKDPMRTLYPGGGSSVRSTWTFVGPEEPGERGVVVPLPQDHLELEVTGAHEQRDDSVILLAEPGRGIDHQVSWTQRDAPSYGLRQTFRGEPVTQKVRGERARIEWEDDRTWWISAVDLMPLLPDRPRLLRALDRRFRRAANPEPAIPSSLRGKDPDLDFVAQLRPALQSRAGIGYTEVDPLFPRKLIKARGTRAISTVEGALTLWTQLAQEQVASTWGIVMPAPLDPSGTGFYSSPAGYSEGVVGVQTADGAVWIDVGCRMCAPFELRPHLEGAAMLCPAGPKTPPPTPGEVTVEDRVGDEGSTRHVVLSGPAALIERQRLSMVPPDARQAALQDHWCGSCKLTAGVGLGKPGQPIQLDFEVTGDPIDPLDASRFASGFDDWHDWIGTRRWSRPGDAAEHSWSEAGVAWSRTVTAGMVVETVALEDRRLPADLWTRWTAARASEPAAPAPTPLLTGEDGSSLQWTPGQVEWRGAEDATDVLTTDAQCYALDPESRRFGLPAAASVQHGETVLDATAGAAEEVTWICEDGSEAPAGPVRWLELGPTGFVLP